MGYVENSTELIVLNLTNGQVEKAPSTSTNYPDYFPGLDDDVLEKVLTFYNGVPTENDELIKMNPAHIIHITSKNSDSKIPRTIIEALAAPDAAK